MVGLLFGAVVMFAAGVWLARGMRVRSARRRAASGPGSTPDLAIVARTFDAIDETVARRRCACGEPLRTTGEGARQVGNRRLRLVRLACDECEDETIVYFDVTAALH